MSDSLDTVWSVLGTATTGTPQEVNQLNRTCSACGSESVWRESLTAAFLCRSCNPPARLPVAEVVGPPGRLSVTPASPVKVAAWLHGWSEIAATTKTTPVQVVEAAMSECDAAFEAGDLEAFTLAIRKVRVAAQTHMKATGNGEAAA
jgi:hypothetical protein